MTKVMSCPWGNEYYGRIKEPYESRFAYYYLRPEMKPQYLKVLDAMHGYKRSVDVDGHISNQDLFELV